MWQRYKDEGTERKWLVGMTKEAEKKFFRTNIFIYNFLFFLPWGYGILYELNWVHVPTVK